jgi:ribokinase
MMFGAISVTTRLSLPGTRRLRRASLYGVMRVVVVGSINADLTVQVARLPAPGETVAGDSLRHGHGGKSANQAVAAAAAGAVVELVAAVGHDDAGADELRELQRAGVRTAGVARLAGVGTGVAVIAVEPAGENQIIVVPGANGQLSAEQVSGTLERLALSPGDVVLTGHEVNAGPVAAALGAAARAGATAILNPAPARELPESLTGVILTPNETESHELTGEADAGRAAEALHARTGAPLIVTLGSAGALIVGASGATTVAAPQVNPVDTTGAGDVFNGVLAARLAAGDELNAAVVSAVAAATESTTWRGARRPDPTP